MVTTTWTNSQGIRNSFSEKMHSFEMLQIINMYVLYSSIIREVYYSVGSNFSLQCNAQKVDMGVFYLLGVNKILMRFERHGTACTELKVALKKVELRKFPAFH